MEEPSMPTTTTLFSFATLEAAFQMLCRRRDPLALDGQALGHNLPRRAISLLELRSILTHPATTPRLRVELLAEVADQVRVLGDSLVGAVGSLVRH